MEPSPGEVTRLLNEMRNGNRAAESKLYDLVYRELLRQAAGFMRRESPDDSWQPADLVHETYKRLVDQREVPRNRGNFFAVAAAAMRRILLDRARRRKAGKRPPPDQRIVLDQALIFSEDKSDELMALDEALQRLAQRDPRQSQIVELRYFGGLSVDETAEAIGLSNTQVGREWNHAKVWLHRELRRNA